MNYTNGFVAGEHEIIDVMAFFVENASSAYWNADIRIAEMPEVWIKGYPKEDPRKWLGKRRTIRIGARDHNGRPRQHFIDGPGKTSDAKAERKISRQRLALTTVENQEKMIALLTEIGGKLEALCLKAGLVIGGK
jgi:hypothetical protein